MRRRISITLGEDLLRKLDETAGGEAEGNRSRMIEELLTASLSPGLPQAVVLAGDERVFRQMSGKPVLAHILETLKSQGVQDILVAETPETAAKAAGIIDQLGGRIKQFEQRRKEGTAAALRAAKKLLTATFLLVYGDNFFDLSLKELVSFHRQTGALVTAGLTTTNTPSEYGVVQLEGKFVTAFNEKPREADSHLVSAGIFVVDRKAVSLLAPEARSLEKDVFPGLVSDRKLAGCVLSGKWMPAK